MSMEIVKTLVTVLVLVSCVRSLDFYNSDIQTVTDETRYMSLNPEVELTAFNKLRLVKGNYIFSLGERITGDRLLLTHMDEIQFTKSEDIEVLLRYPASGKGTSTITYIEIIANLSSDDADAFLIDGGIDQKYAEMLLTCNKTINYGYQIFIYGF